MGILQEFRAFAVRGNMIDMAVGIIIGGAFGKIVSSLVADVLMPPLGLLIGGLHFTELAFTLKDAGDGAAAVTMNYGNFIQHLFDFMIVAFAIFLLVKGINRLRRSEEEKPAPPAPPSKEAALLAEIRDLLRQR
jgi:large conductance mechanosensitive channel